MPFQLLNWQYQSTEVIFINDIFCFLHSREVDRQSPTWLILNDIFCLLPVETLSA